ncbi:hypothetical protein ACH4SK_03770 [Streptomyces inhibens]|uniref:hypothetical protein n=1 Tax=Streptomyces inhibens TaxID=2293571 RepID=UPI0037B083CB
MSIHDEDQPVFALLSERAAPLRPLPRRHIDAERTQCLSLYFLGCPPGSIHQDAAFDLPVHLPQGSSAVGP